MINLKTLFKLILITPPQYKECFFKSLKYFKKKFETKDNICFEKICL